MSKFSGIHLEKIIAIAIGVMLVLLFLYLERPRPPSSRASFARASETRSVTVALAERLEIPVVVEAVGTVRSRRETEVASRLLAAVEEVHVRPGDRIEQGAVIVTLERSDLEASVAEAEANLQSAEELVAEAETELTRTRNLYDREATTLQALESATFRAAEARARREAARKSVELARTQLGFATIRAPFDAIVYERLVDPGDMATPGKVLVGVYDSNELRLEANVASSVLARVSLGDEIVVSIDAVSRDVVGKVGEIVPWIDRRTRTGMLKIDLPREEELRPGHFGRARITTSTREAIAIPEAAAVRRGQLELVYVVRDDPTLEPSSRASLELVRFGRSIGTDGARLEVTSGLEAGARVIVSPPESLRDGDPVRIAEERATSSTPVDSTRSTFGG